MRSRQTSGDDLVSRFFGALPFFLFQFSPSKLAENF
jgi:hypothetical protein